MCTLNKHTVLLSLIIRIIRMKLLCLFAKHLGIPSLNCWIKRHHLKILIGIIFPLNSLGPSLKGLQLLNRFHLEHILYREHVRAKHSTWPEEFAVAVNCVKLYSFFHLYIIMNESVSIERGTYVLHRKWTSYLILSVLSLTMNSPGSMSRDIIIISPFEFSLCSE